MILIISKLFGFTCDVYKKLFLLCNAFENLCWNWVLQVEYLYFSDNCKKNNVYKGNWICINRFLKGVCPFLKNGLENISLNSYYLIKFSQAVLGHG